MENTQVDVTPTIKNFIENLYINNVDDFCLLRDKIHKYLIVKHYDKRSCIYADTIQWKRTATQILVDRFVYEDKSCSDLTLVFIALCKGLNIDAQLIKLVRCDIKSSHTISQFIFNNVYYTFDVQSKKSLPRIGEYTKGDIYISQNNNKYTVYKIGVDLWSMGLKSIKDEYKLYK